MAIQILVCVSACACDDGAHHACINALVVLSKALLFIAEILEGKTRKPRPLTGSWAVLLCELQSSTI